MKKVVVLSKLLVVCHLAACNYDTGECYLRDEVGNGAGGGIITQPGAGGFGDVPPEPQGAGDPPEPDCNIVNPGPCEQKCLTDYGNAAVECAKIQDESQRKTCDNGAYSRYKTCREGCIKKENDCLEHCKDLCYQIMDKCKEDCKTDPNVSECRSRCTEAYGKCLKECDKKCKQ